MNAEAIQDVRAQLAQVDARIAECLAAREVIRQQASHRINEQRLHGLYMLQWDVKKDLAHCEAACPWKISTWGVVKTAEMWKESFV